ncbi:MAG: PD-(D/E)XK nuclease family protein [Elusimicrobia bacterium]|nr:PD-(D/E)XK nuclease family protein [Elusimicrobiota bacterium]
MESDSSTKFSPSKLDTYKNCPRRYRYRYVDKIKRDAKTVEAFLGTCVHTAFEKLYEAVGHGKLPALEEVLRAFEEEWSAGWSPDITIKDRAFAPEDWKELGRECVKIYYDQNKPFDGDRTVAVEKRVGFPLPVDGQEYRIEGFVDRLALGKDGAFEIHDYKTGKTLPPQSDADSDWQLAIYDAAVRQDWPDTKSVRLIWHYVRHGKSLVSTRTAAQLEALKGEIATLIRAIKQDHEFAPHKSLLCDWCEYRDLCPLWAHAEKVAQMSFEALKKDEGVKLVDQLAGAEARRKELRDKLRELDRDEEAVRQALIRFAEAHGVSALAGLEGEVSISEKDDYRFPTKTHSPEALEALERELRSSPLWKEVSHLDAHRFLDAYKRKEWPEPLMKLAEDLLNRYAKRTREKTVRFRRKRETDED